MLSAYMALIDSEPVRREFEKFYNENRRLGMSKAYSLLGNIQMAEYIAQVEHPWPARLNTCVA